MTESTPETASQPGQILKTAREELSLSIEQVAQELHLRPAVVKALEEEKYSEFSSDVFLKGYFRTYCRLVKLQEESMVEMLEKQLNLLKVETDHLKEQEIKSKQSRKRRKKLVSVFIFLVCAGLIYLAYLLATGALQLFEDSSRTQPIMDEVVTSEPGATPEAGAGSAEQDDTLADDQEAGDESAPEGNLDSTLENNEEPDSFPESEDQAELQNSKDSTSDEQATNATAISVAPVVRPAASEIAAFEMADSQARSRSQTERAATSVEASLIVRFSGDCWFKLTDGTGKTVIADLKRENQEVNYQGISPFHVVIGDASKATLVFEGQTVDLAQYSSRNGRAELNLKIKDGQPRGE